MAQPYVGEIRMFGGSFAPAGWMFCEGQLLPISENETLFYLIGTTYGGDGESTFALPNMASRVPVHMGNGPGGTNYALAQMAGTEQETLTVQQIPTHSHPLLASTSAAQLSPTGAVPTVPSGGQGLRPYNNVATPNTTLNPSSVVPTGGSQPHTNTQPFLCVSFIISLFGIFPSPT